MSVAEAAPAPDRPAPPWTAHDSADRAPEAPPARRAREPSSPRVELGVGMTGAPLGVAPASALGATGFASLRASAFEIGVEGWAGLPASAPVSSLHDASVRTSLSGGASTACLHFGMYFGCAVGFVGSLRAQAPGVSGASTGSGLEVLGGPRAGIALPLGVATSLAHLP
jgi:hypothetical protein